MPIWSFKGGACKKVLDGLFNRALITPDGEGWRVAAEGYDALGEPHPGVNPKRIGKFEEKLDQIIANAKSTTDTPTEDTAPPTPNDAGLEVAVASAEASFTPPPSPHAPARTASRRKSSACCSVPKARLAGEKFVTMTGEERGKQSRTGAVSGVFDVTRYTGTMPRNPAPHGNFWHKKTSREGWFS